MPQGDEMQIRRAGREKERTPALTGGERREAIEVRAGFLDYFYTERG
jgi:hypothetical protein